MRVNASANSAVASSSRPCAAFATGFLQDEGVVEAGACGEAVEVGHRPIWGTCIRDQR